MGDDGPGAPESERKRIFERFYRLDAARSTPGDGLGLSVVAAIAELHGMAYAAEDNAPGLRIVFDMRIEILDQRRPYERRNRRSQLPSGETRRGPCCPPTKTMPAR